jgi:hypothetical protein
MLSGIMLPPLADEVLIVPLVSVSWLRSICHISLARLIQLFPVDDSEYELSLPSTICY